MISNNTTKNNNDLNLDFVQISNLSKGSDVYYIDSTSLNNNGYTWINATCCKLLDFDRQVGEAPFYTIVFPNGREIQTEGYRLVFSLLIFIVNIHIYTNLQLELLFHPYHNLYLLIIPIYSSKQLKLFLAQKHFIINS